MQKISELLNIKLTVGNQLTIYHPIFKDKLIYCETISSGWSKMEYDLNENIIYIESNDDYWSKCEFDHNRNIIYIESSNDGIILDIRANN